MVKAFNKKESKRMTCHKKYKIRKKVREHNKKLAKSLKNTIKKKKKISGNIPNLAPFKEEMLLEALNQKEAETQQKLLNKKKKQPIVVTKPKEAVKATVVKTIPASITIAQCDLIIWVIDVRSPMECFSDEVWTEITSAKKSVVFVLNKIDLVPKHVADQWYSVISAKSPTFVMKSTEVILTECEQIISALKATVARFGGVKSLLAYLNQNLTQETKVGVIGGPQVGKSCVISTILKGCGRTKAKRTSETKLSEKIRLATTPGLIEMEYSGILGVMSNMHQYMNHPTEVLSALTKCISKQDAMYHFTLPDYQHPAGLPDALAIRYNLYYNKEPDHEAVGRLVLKQLRDRKLKFYVACQDEIREGIPEEQIQDVQKLLYQGDALKLNSSQLSIVITKKEKKKRRNEMDVDEENDDDEDELLESDDDSEEYDEEDEEEEMC